MTFYWPHAFWLLLIPFALAIREWRFRRVPGATNIHPKILRAEAGRSSLIVRPVSFRRGPNGPRWRLLLGLSLSIIALARPQWGRIEEPVFDQAREILIALDLSRSMLSTDVKPTRLDRSRLLITSLLEHLKGERVGLVVFSGTAFLQSPLSSDYEILSEFLPQLGPDFLPEGGTNYNALLETSIAAFGASGAADRFLIVLSDGEAQSEDWHKYVDELKTKGIRVISLGVGTDDGSMIPDGAGAFMKDERGAVVLSKLNNSTLRELADKTGGVYTDASSWVDLAQLIQTTVNQGKRGEFKDVSRVRLAERYQWALAPALLFLIWSFWREFPVRPKPRALRLAQESAQPLAAALLLFLILLPPSVFAAAKITSDTDPLAAPLTKLVGKLSASESINAADYASFAKSTIEYGEHLQSSQQPVPPGPIHDALAGVKAGRSLDTKAADWTALREKLEALLQKKDPPKDDEKKQDQKQPDKNKSDDSKKDKSDQKQDQKNQEQKNDSSKSPQKDQNKEDDSSPKDDSKDSSSKKDDPSDKGQNSPEQPKDQPPKSGGQSAFGDMKNEQKDSQPPSEASPSTPPPGEMQQVGGTSEKQKEQAAQLDPSLELPLQNLDQIRQQDSPARLYQLLQDPNSKTPARSGHNW